MNTTKTLIEYGLSEGEAKIYLSLLELIDAPVYQIAKQTSIPRATIYKALEVLKSKSLVLSSKKNGVLHYTPENPKIFQETLQRKQDMMQDIMPELRALIESSSIKPAIKFYEGRENLKKVWDDILETIEHEHLRETLAITHPSIYQVLPRYFPEWVTKRVTLGVRAKLIVPDIPASRVLEDKKALREIKYLPKKNPYQCTVDIYGNKLAFFSLKKDEINSIILESPAISEMFRSFFLTMWELL